MATNEAPQTHESVEKLSTCAIKLEGEIILPQPRVSREVFKVY
jgi:hypothetical protein